MNIRLWNPWIGCLLAACAGLVGCAPKTNVSATGNVPAQYSHVYMSVQEVWFNTSATASPDDTAWIKFPLDTPVTVDLASSMQGTLNSITSGLTVPIGSYAQVRIIPVDPTATLLSSAQTLGALYNSEVDYTDSAGTLHQVALELLHPDKGIGIPTSLSVTNTGYKIFSSSSSSSSSDSSSSSSSDSSSSTSSTTTTNATFSMAINIDAARDVVPFRYNSVSGQATSGVVAMLLNPHATVYDTSTVGAIQGTLNIGSLTGITNPSTSGFVDIQVTAESVSTDGSRHVVVNSTPVSADGTFTLYPLATSSSSPTSYDLVIHGPAIATVIVKGVTVNVGDPTSTTPVNIGTITPRAASSYTVNLDTTNPIPAGSLVGFYQTLPGTSEVPYVVEQQTIDPFTRAFDADRAISAGSIDYGTFSSTGSTISLTTADPTEGVSTYRVAASAPLFTDGALTTTVTNQNSSTALVVAVPTLAAGSGFVLTAPTLSVTPPAAGTFDKGYVILSHNGAIVGAAALDTVLAQSGTKTLAIAPVPAGSGSSTSTDSALYDVSVRVWKSTDPAATLAREIFPTALDLRTGSIPGYALTID